MLFLLFRRVNFSRKVYLKFLLHWRFRTATHHHRTFLLISYFLLATLYFRAFWLENLIVGWKLDLS